jgi:hypothetical protein
VDGVAAVSCPEPAGGGELGRLYLRQYPLAALPSLSPLRLRSDYRLGIQRKKSLYGNTIGWREKTHGNKKQRNGKKWSVRYIAKIPGNRANHKADR